MTISARNQQLVDEQSIERFDQDYISDDSLDRLLKVILAVNPQIDEVADFGGGNGRLLDRLLKRLPHAHGTNYEISKHLRSLNAHSPRKTVSAESFLVIDAHAKFDLILINWVLHHLVGNSLSITLQLIRSATEVAARALKPGGLIVVSENLIQSTFSERFASAALFKVTGSRLLKPVISRMRDGAAIAGVGIYYMSEPQLHAMFPEFKHVATLDQGQHDYGWKLKLIGVTRVKERVLVFQKDG